MSYKISPPLSKRQIFFFKNVCLLFFIVYNFVKNFLLKEENKNRNTVIAKTKLLIGNGQLYTAVFQVSSLHLKV